MREHYCCSSVEWCDTHYAQEEVQQAVSSGNTSSYCSRISCTFVTVTGVELSSVVCVTDGAGALQETEFKKANKDELRAVFKYLEFCLQQVVKDNELGALQQV